MRLMGIGPTARVRWVVLPALVGGLLASCGGSSSEQPDDLVIEAGQDLVIEADDGSAILVIPPESLPAGLDPADLLVTRVPIADLGTPVAPAPPGGSFAGRYPSTGLRRAPRRTEETCH